MLKYYCLLSVYLFAIKPAIADFTISQIGEAKANAGTIFIDEPTGLNNGLTSFTKTIVACALAFGFIIGAKGLHMIYEASQANTQQSYAKGIVVVLTGGALAALPWLVFTSSNTVQGLVTQYGD